VSPMAATPEEKERLRRGSRRNVGVVVAVIVIALVQRRGRGGGHRHRVGPRCGRRLGGIVQPHARPESDAPGFGGDLPVPIDHEMVERLRERYGRTGPGELSGNRERRRNPGDHREDR